MLSIRLLCLLGLVSGQARIDPLVSTKVGLIRGLVANDGYSKFLGIPYALVDEKNPFGPSVPHPNFNDTYEAYDDTITCPQASEDGVSGTIQCLSLNIFVPNTATSQNRLPVMVWIHGGSFVNGSAANTGPNPIDLLKQDVILVAINYRLGVYGFMCLDTPEVPGNQGLKDQVLALKWIKNNIEAFGGDVNKITIFGQSAGAMCINMHLFSPHPNLFHTAIIQSGPALSPAMMIESNTTIPLRLAEILGFETTDVSLAISYLSAVDPQLVVAAAFDDKIANSAGTNQPKTLPCVEKHFEGIENFISEHPMNMKPTYNVPVIIGYTSNEFGFQLEMVSPDYFDRFRLRPQFDQSFNSHEIMDKASEAVSHFYMGDEEISEKVRFPIIDCGSDFIFAHPTQRMAEQLSNSGVKNVYNYIFSYSGGKNTMKIKKNMTSPGATHGDDLGYLFDRKNSEESSEDSLMVKRFITLWTNFAKYGDPTPETNDLIPIKWTPMSNNKYYYLNMGSELTLESRPFHERMAFWDLFYTLYGKYQKWYKTLTLIDKL